MPCKHLPSCIKIIAWISTGRPTPIPSSNNSLKPFSNPVWSRKNADSAAPEQNQQVVQRYRPGSHCCGHYPGAGKKMNTSSPCTATSGFHFPQHAVRPVVCTVAGNVDGLHKRPRPFIPLWHEWTSHCWDDLASRSAEWCCGWNRTRFQTKDEKKVTVVLMAMAERAKAIFMKPLTLRVCGICWWSL